MGKYRTILWGGERGRRGEGKEGVLSISRGRGGARGGGGGVEERGDSSE